MILREVKLGEEYHIPFTKIFIGRFSFLLISIILMFVLKPLLHGFLGANILMDIFFTIVLFSGIYAVSQKRSVFVVAVVNAIPVLIAMWSAYFVNLPIVRLIGNVFGIIFFFYMAVIMLSYFLKKDEITSEVIMGAICVFFMLGYMWALAYRLLEMVNPGSFSIPQELGSELSGFVYYSFVTLTTLGYGDITPITAPARSFSVLEAATGQLYIAVLIARLGGHPHFTIFESEKNKQFIIS